MLLLTGSEVLEEFGIDYFREGSSFGALSEDAVGYLLDKGEVLKLDDGEALFHIGDPARCFHIVLQGAIRFEKPRSSGGFTHIRDYLFGQEIGFVAMIGLHDRVGNAYGVGETYILKVSCNLFNEMHCDLPNDFGILLLNLSREMSRRLRDADNRLAEAGVEDWSAESS